MHGAGPRVGRDQVPCVTVEDRREMIHVLALAHAESDQRPPQPLADAPIDRVLQVRAGGLPGGIVAGDRRLTQGALGEGIGTQGVSVVEVLVASGQLEDALADGRLQTVTGARAIRAPVGEAADEGGEADKAGRLRRSVRQVAASPDP